MLSKRLRAIADYVPAQAVMADIGTDHGYLPVSLLKEQKIEFAVLCDINKKPLERACAHAREENIPKSQYLARLGNGLEACLDLPLQGITISGMGGSLMVEILEAYPEKVASLEWLIVAPNFAPWLLRECLSKQGFKVKKETVVEENQKFYEILYFVKGEEVLSELDLFFGPTLRKNEAFEAYFNARYQKEKKRFDHMRSHADKDERIRQELAYKEALWKDRKNG